MIKKKNWRHWNLKRKGGFQVPGMGNSSKMIADKLSISENTLITHRQYLIQNLKVKNSAELIKMRYVPDIQF